MIFDTPHALCLTFSGESLHLTLASGQDLLHAKMADCKIVAVTSLSDVVQCIDPNEIARILFIDERAVEAFGRWWQARALTNTTPKLGLPGENDEAEQAAALVAWLNGNLDA